MSSVMPDNPKFARNRANIAPDESNTKNDAFTLDQHSWSPRVSLFWRLRTAARLLADLRMHDIRTAAVFVRLKYAGQPFLMRWFRFVGWALGQMFHNIPVAMRCLSIDAKVSRTPLWLLDNNPLANHPWQTDPTATLPAEADTVVIGAGFTGGAIAYHWSKRAPSDRRLVVLEMHDPASGSSGRNEGLVVMGRYFKMVYDSVLQHLSTVRSDLTLGQREQLAWQFADRYCRAASRNAQLIKETIEAERFDCDYVCAGWVQAREPFEESLLTDSVRIAQESGHGDWTSLSPDEVLRRTGMRVSCDAGFSVGAASWHPAKWVWCLLKRALESSAVSLFTRTRVVRVEDGGAHYLVHTDRGIIRAKYVVYATETYTPKLDERLRGAILPIVEQAACGVGGPEAMRPHVGISTSWFFTGRYGRRVIFGSGGPRVPDAQAGLNRPSRFLTSFVASELFRFFGPYRMHLTNEWSGTTGYSPDQYPLVGLLDGKRLYVIGGMCGSGSGVSFNAGRCIVNRILGNTAEQDDYPAEYFAPSRLLAPQAHAWPDIATSKHSAHSTPASHRRRRNVVDLESRTTG